MSDRVLFNWTLNLDLSFQGAKVKRDMLVLRILHANGSFINKPVKFNDNQFIGSFFENLFLKIFVKLKWVLS